MKYSLTGVGDVWFGPDFPFDGTRYYVAETIPPDLHASYVSINLMQYNALTPEQVDLMNIACGFYTGCDMLAPYGESNIAIVWGELSDVALLRLALETSCS